MRRVADGGLHGADGDTDEAARRRALDGVRRGRADENLGLRHTVPEPIDPGDLGRNGGPGIAGAGLVEDELAVDDDVRGVAAASLHHEDVPRGAGDDVAVLGEEEEAIGGEDAGEEGEAQGLVRGEGGSGPSERGSILGRLLSAGGLRPQLDARLSWA